MGLFKDKQFYFDFLKSLDIKKIHCTMVQNVEYDALYDYCTDRHLYHIGLVKEDSDNEVIVPITWENKKISSLWDSEYYVMDIWAEYIPDAIIIKCMLVNKLRNFEEYNICAFTKEEFQKNGFDVMINTDYLEEEEDVT